MVGMSKSGSRYGRRSNWFKIHCLLQEQQQSSAQITAAANLLRPHPYLTPIFRNPQTTIPQHQPRELSGRSSESDSGASSADPEDELRSNSALSYLKPSASPSSDREFYLNNKKLSSPASDSEFFTRKKTNALNLVPSVSPASLPSVSPSGLVPKWLPPTQGIGDPTAWRDLWLRAPPPVAAPAPDQDQPIDLSVKSKCSQDINDNIETESDSENALSIDVGVDEPVKSAPLDLTLERHVTDVSN